MKVVTLDDNVTVIDSDAHLDALLVGGILVPVRQTTLKVNRAFSSIYVQSSRMKAEERLHAE